MGAAGPTGPGGAAGSAGAAGAAGPVGAAGPTGPGGAAGVAGTAGAAGPVGAAGPTGPVGAAGNPTSIYSLYWGDGTNRCAKITFTIPVTVDLRFNRIRCTLKIRAVSNYLNYPILCFNDNHTYPSFNNYFTEASISTSQRNTTNPGYFAYANNIPVFSSWGDYSMCFMPNNANEFGNDPYWILQFDCDLRYDRATGTYEQMVANGTWTLVDKTVGNVNNVIFWSGTFTRLSELAGPTYNLSKIGFASYSNGGNFSLSIRNANIIIEVIPTNFTYQSGGQTI